jgi:hypothetical protein
MSWLIKQFGPADDDKREQETITREFETPAEGDAFGFRVVVHRTSKAGGRRHERGVWADAEEERRAADELIGSIVREVCRRHSPFRPGAAEREVNTALGNSFAQHSTLARRWTVRAEIGLTEEVRELQRRSLAEQHQINAEATAVSSRLRALDEARKQAESFLTELSTSWTSRYAIKLAQHPELAAGIVEDMLVARRADADHLIKTVQDMVDAHRTADIYELVISSEGALRQALGQLGVALPPADPDPLFVPADLG